MNENRSVKEYREEAQKILSLDHFSSLRVSRTATPDEVQRAFFEAVKTWHPDRVPTGLGEIKPLVAQVFARLDMARATLGDPARRLRYVQELEKPTQRASAADLSTAEAGLELKKAEAFSKRGETAVAERHLHRALQLAPNLHEARALLAWNHVKAESTPAELQKALEDLDRVIAADPVNKKAFFYRAQLRKRIGLAKDAYADFVRVSELEPANIDAQREVRLYKMRAEKSGAHPKHGKGNDTSAAPEQPSRSAGGHSPPRPRPKDIDISGFFRKLFKR